MPVDLGRQPAMPEFASPYYGFRHTLDSALSTLGKLGVPRSNISVRVVLEGTQAGRIVLQKPAAGAALGPHDRVELHVGGAGFFHRLPSGYWDSGGETEIGTREVAGLIDDPLEKAGSWIREGSRLFDILPENRDACRRFIELFGLDPREWPESSWYRLAILLPSLHRLAGTERGLLHGLSWMLDLPVEAMAQTSSYCYLPPDERTRLGGYGSRLGVDFVLGVQREQIAQLRLVLGPVPLEVYQRYQTDAERRRLLEAVLRLLAPTDRAVKADWRVLDPTQAPCLGQARRNALLGINTYLGEAGAMATPA